MAVLSKSSKAKLSTVHADLRRVIEDAIHYYDFKVIHGVRTPGEQFELYKVGRKKYGDNRKVVGKTVTQLDGYIKKSKHNHVPSLAVDIVPYPIDWGDIDRFKDMAKVVKASADRLGVKIIWGGDWASFRDYPHFQLA